MNDEHWMSLAIEQARKAEDAGEVPVGAVIVKADELIAVGYNHPIEQHDPTSHAEIEALRRAGVKLGNYRMPGTTMYVTLEPCPMCVSAMVHARIDRVVFGADDPKTGAMGGAYDVMELTKPNHRIDVTRGVLAEECSHMLREFFRARR